MTRNDRTRNAAPASRTPYEQGRDAYYLHESDGSPYPDGPERAQWRRGWNDARNHWEDTPGRTDEQSPSVRSRVAGQRRGNYA